MRKKALILSLLCAFVLSIQAKEKVIERPSFVAWNTTTVELDKIVVSDTATVLHIHAFFRPHNWIKFPKETYLIDDNGTRYPIKASDGITIGEKFFMPESGEAQFKLIFPPIPASLTQIDMIEDVDDGFKIWGIQLNNNKITQPQIPAEFANTKINLNGDFPELTFKNGKAKLRGKILDYKPGMNHNLYFMAGTPMGIDQDRLVVKEDGSFETEIDVLTPTPCSINLCKSIKFFMAPGETTDLLINMREKSRAESRFRKDEAPLGKPYYFSGYLAGLAEEYNSHSKMYDIDDFFTEIKGKDLNGIKEYFLDNHQKQLNELATLNVSPACKKVLTGQLASLTFMHITNAKAFYIEDLFESKKITREEVQKYYEETTLPENYYKGLESLSAINTPDALYNINFSMLVGNTYIGELLSEALGTDQGFYFQFANVAQIFNNINDFIPLTAEDRAKLSALPSPAFLAMAEEKNNALLAKMEANKKKSGFNVNEAGEVTNEDLFASMISKFSGKAILVDFWATWCGPCIQANKTMAPMKEELKDEDIVYLYIAGDNSPEKTWENMIPDIHGEHFRMNKDQWNYLCKEFSVDGVPTYLVVDREGNVTYKQTGFPGVDRMKEELTKALGN